MASSKKPSAARLKTILRRQMDAAWDASYQPSILATVAEAPSISRASILTPDKLRGREVHVLSSSERALALLGFYHPCTVGLQEQRMLDPAPSLHPLWTFPGISNIDLRPLKGVVDVAERLGYGNMLPTVDIPDGDKPGQSLTTIFPYVGDQLWAIRGGKNGIYVVDWNIKDTYKAFKCPPPRANGKPRREQDLRAALARHDIQTAYYRDAGIRSVQIAGEGLDFHVASNLRQLFLHHRRQVDVPPDLKAETLERFRAALVTGIPALEVIMMYGESERCTVHQCRDLFYQFIWNRDLRLDLFQPVLIDRPMHPEERDVVEVYADWFTE